MEKTVLFLCTGNTCRSPMAEAYFNWLGQHRSEKTGCTKGEVVACPRAVSAGLCAVDGARASVQSREVMRRIGVDLESFRSRTLTQEMIEATDFLVVMTAGHKMALERNFALSPEKKVFRLMEFADGGDVGDPFGGSVGDYERCFAQMKGALERLWNRVAEGNEKK